MKIGIVGASISGLIAGQKLAKAGHDVTVIERMHSLGGKFATRELDGLQLDYGISYFAAESKTFRDYLEELNQKGAVKKWAEEFNFYNGSVLKSSNPHSSPQTYFTGSRGMQSIVKNLSRWVDVISEISAGGVTYIGADRSKKRPWMINLSDFSVFECDAVIIAAPAVEAYGLLQTGQDETAIRRIIRTVDEVEYNGCISLAATFDQPIPDWKGIECKNSSLQWIGNESSKQGGSEKTGLLIQSTADFYQEHAELDDKTLKQLLLEEAAKVVDSWILKPQSTYLHRWKYFEARNPINEYFMELEMDDAPFVLIGDYLGGNSVENAFLSGYNLAEYWINKYSNAALTAVE
ncbi:MAG TPA: FAD-dependent oxidoreductase [Balneolaceae bacterium]|nr:FAD-dependent oxidoreductase [Balneolaceae bacterium]